MTLKVIYQTNSQMQTVMICSYSQQAVEAEAFPFDESIERAVNAHLDNAGTKAANSSQLSKSKAQDALSQERLGDTVEEGGSLGMSAQARQLSDILCPNGTRAFICKTGICCLDIGCELL